MANKIDSNVTGLRYAEEASIGVLPGSPVWYPLEPNGYNDFGGELKTVAREPISPTRQRKKGVTVDLDASGGFGHDLLQGLLTRLFQGFFFADLREKVSTLPMNGTAIPITNVDGTGEDFEAASGLDAFAPNMLVFASGFAQAANNGLHLVSSASATSLVTTSDLVAEAAPPATAKVVEVGFQHASATVNIDVSGSYPRLVRVSGTVDFTTFGLIPGEWIFIGGDAAATKFVNAVNNGFARVRDVGTTYIEFDKTAGTMVAETGTGLTIRLFWGNVLQNEGDAALIVRRSFQLERTLGEDTVGTMSEYLTGSVANELALQVRQADKVTVDLGFVSTDNEQRDGTAGVKSGTRPTATSAEAFNTSSDFSRIKMHQVIAGDTNPTALFAFLTELSITVNNNVTPNKAVGVLGAFDVSAGNFNVSGSMTAYFASIDAVQAVRNNADVTIDMALVKSNAGMVWDIPLLSLGDGRLKVEKDKPITLPLTMDGAEGPYGSTLVMVEFPYLPNAADV